MVRQDTVMTAVRTSSEGGADLLIRAILGALRDRVRRQLRLGDHFPSVQVFAFRRRESCI